MLPNDPVILLSYVNTKLRDDFNSLEELCITEDVKLEDITEKLAKIQYQYDKNTNRFI